MAISATSSEYSEMRLRLSSARRTATVDLGLSLKVKSLSITFSASLSTLSAEAIDLLARVPSLQASALSESSNTLIVMSLALEISSTRRGGNGFSMLADILAMVVA